MKELVCIVLSQQLQTFDIRKRRSNGCALPARQKIRDGRTDLSETHRLHDGRDGF